MRAEFLSRLTTTSRLAELPGYDVALDGQAKARLLGDLFREQPGLPGVLLTRHGRVYSAVSRRYYFEMVGRYCGMDLYHPRPIQLMMDRFQGLGGALELPAELPIRDAVQQGLERPRELIYEPVVARAPDGTARLVDFEDLLIADSRLSYLRTLQMGQILGSVGEGLLLLREDRRVGSEYSLSVERILATRDLAGRTLGELLFGRVAGETCLLAEQFLDVLYQPRVIESLVGDLNPLRRVELRVVGESRPRVLAFRFARSLEEGRVRHVLVRVEDLTQVEEQARELASQRAATELRVGIAFALADADPEALQSFFHRLERQLNRLREPRQPTAAELGGWQRELHALKGEAGLLELHPFRTGLHQLENGLEAGVHGLNRAALQEQVGHLEALQTETRGLLARFRRLAQATAPRRAAPADGLDRFDGLERLERYVAQLAKELGKPARLVRRLGGATIPAAMQPALLDVFVQLVRNALVHGLEPGEVRVAAGKPLIGTLQIAARPHAGWLELVFQDDGAGLDAALTEKIFEPGFSTAPKTTEHAGRGVGLDVVKSRVEALGGRIAVHSERGRFCAFQIVLPQPAQAAA